MNLSALIKKGGLRGVATATVATDDTPTRSRVATVAVALARNPVNDRQAAPALPLGGDPDRWCWPHSGAMHRGEIDTFMARLALFTGKGKSLEEAERLADKLVTRDREGDDRRSCLECTHLHGTGRRRCSQAQWTGDARVGVPAEQSNMLQRCNGFKAALPGQSPSPSAR